MVTADDGSEWPQELKDFFDEDVFMNPKKYGLVKVKKPFTHTWVLRLPEEVGVEEELRYSELHPGYQGEEWAPSTPTFISDIWDFREMSEDMDIFLKECKQKEELLRLQARSPLPSGEYFVPDENKEGFLGRQAVTPPKWASIRQMAEEADLADLTVAMAVYLNRIDEHLNP